MGGTKGKARLVIFWSCLFRFVALGQVWIEVKRGINTPKQVWIEGFFQKNAIFFAFQVSFFSSNP